MSYSLGIDLGGSSVKAVAVTPESETLHRSNTDFDVQKRMDWSEKIRALVQKVSQERGRAPESIGLSAPGLAALDGKSIANLPDRLDGLEGLNWAEFLQSPQPIPVLNDGHAALLGEVWCGAGRGCGNVIMFTLGTGVGGAAMVDGKLLKGRAGRAGHLGHLSLDPDGTPDICGTPGSLEVAIGNYNIFERSGGRYKTTHDMISAHIKGESEATRVWLKSVKALAAGVASCINILDPEVVIIGGGVARAGKALFEPLDQFLEPMEWKPLGERARIVPAQLGEFAGALGAAWNGMNESRLL